MDSVLVRSDVYFHTAIILPCYYCQIPSAIPAPFNKIKRMCINCINEAIRVGLIEPTTGKWVPHDL